MARNVEFVLMHKPREGVLIVDDPLEVEILPNGSVRLLLSDDHLESMCETDLPALLKDPFVP